MVINYLGAAAGSQAARNQPISVSDPQASSLRNHPAQSPGPGFKPHDMLPGLPRRSKLLSFSGRGWLCHASGAGRRGLFHADTDSLVVAGGLWSKWALVVAASGLGS